MKRRLFALAILLFVAFAARPTRAANDPDLAWFSIKTTHFTINYHSGEELIARHVADLAESIYTRLTPAVGWEPSERTEIVLTDSTDSANGSAGALPYNAVHLYVTAPDDMSPLGDVDDWYLELLTHEYTHVLHTDHIEGIPALINRFIGKTYAPNQVEPHWMLEGLAVFEESERTSGGRLRSSMWNMWMRADILENNIATLDVFSNVPKRWPQGNIWYLYGSFFMQWIAETYGEDAIRRMIDDYSYQIIPYGINRSTRRAMGRTFEELYPSFVDSMKRSFGEQAAAIRGRGLREGVRITTQGNTVEYPRFIPSNTWPGDADDLLYAADDGHTTSGLVRTGIDRDARGNVTGVHDRELMIRTNGIGASTFAPDGTVYFNSTDVYKTVFYYNDLFSIPPGQKSATGLDGRRTRMTVGWRVTDPTVSPDGRRMVFCTNWRGTKKLRIADVTPTSIEHQRILVGGAPFDQAYAPRWSPDNRHVAYSSWSRGGYRDVRIVDTTDGSYVEVTHDRAVDGAPVYSPDGRWLYFQSDRTGVMNIYAYELATGRMKQVTNVLNGAYQPDVSRDGKTLAYVGYTHDGYDIFAMRLDESEWLDALPYIETRPSPPAPPRQLDVTPRAYNPLETLVPRAYSVSITPGNFGEASIVTGTGSDIAGIHTITGSITTEWKRPELQTDVTYTYGRLPFDVSLHGYRHIQPGSGFQLGPNYAPSYVEEVVGADTGISYTKASAFDAQSFGLTYSVSRLGADYVFPTSEVTPWNTPSLPQRGVLASINLGWSYSNAEQFLWSVGPEKGFTVGANLSVSDPALASEFTGYSASFNLETYFLMPWLQHHSLALHVGGGTSGGNLGGHGLFYVGGFVDLPIVDVVRNSLIQGGIELRGYPVVAESGQNYALLNAEYRFPIVNVDRGPSTFPFFLNRINGAAFVDYGSAFNDATTAEFKTGVGGELWFDVTLGYVLTFTFRAGFAKGLASGGLDKTYFIAAVPF